MRIKGLLMSSESEWFEKFKFVMAADCVPSSLNGGGDGGTEYDLPTPRILDAS